MKPFKTLNDLEAAAARHALTCRDVMADPHTMAYEGDGVLTWKRARLLDDRGGPDDGEARMEMHAYRQFAERLHAPRPSWLLNRDYCPADLEHSILDDLRQFRAAKDHKHYMLRLRDDFERDGTTVRAVLSEDYTPFDHTKFIEMVGDALDLVQARELGVIVARSQVGDTMRAYILFSGLTKELPEGKDGGGLHPGIYISNNEIGTGSVRVAAGVWRDVCTNGLIYGWNAEWNRALAHRFYTKAAFSAVIADNVANALEITEEAAEKFVQSYAVEVGKSRVEKILDRWAEGSMTVKSRERWETLTFASVSDYGREREDVRLFDVLNGLTQAAQLADNEDETEVMERMAGDMLALSIPSPLGTYD